MLIHPNKSCFLIVDIQDKLAPAVIDGSTIIENTRWLAEIAAKTGVPILASEQYPKGLGKTVSEIRDIVPEDGVMEKVHFSCMSEPACNEKINAIRPNQVVIAGMETHVCVLQTAIQLRQQAREVYVVADCVSSRKAEDKALGLERLRQAGVYIVSREMVAFEWLQKAGTEQFREVSRDYLR